MRLFCKTTGNLNYDVLSQINDDNDMKTFCDVSLASAILLCTSLTATSHDPLVAEKITRFSQHRTRQTNFEKKTSVAFVTKTSKRVKNNI